MYLTRRDKFNNKTAVTNETSLHFDSNNGVAEFFTAFGFFLLTVVIGLILVFIVYLLWRRYNGEGWPDMKLWLKSGSSSSHGKENLLNDRYGTYHAFYHSRSNPASDTPMKPKAGPQMTRVRRSNRQIGSPKASPRFHIPLSRRVRSSSFTSTPGEVSSVPETPETTGTYEMIETQEATRPQNVMPFAFQSPTLPRGPKASSSKMIRRMSWMGDINPEHLNLNLYRTPPAPDATSQTSLTSKSDKTHGDGKNCNIS